jgi:hypothetical protein
MKKINKIDHVHNNVYTLIRAILHYVVSYKDGLCDYQLCKERISNILRGITDLNFTDGKKVVKKLDRIKSDPYYEISSLANKLINKNQMSGIPTFSGIRLHHSYPIKDMTNEILNFNGLIDAQMILTIINKGKCILLTNEEHTKIHKK